MLTQALAAPVLPIQLHPLWLFLFQLYLVKTKCCFLVILFEKDKLYSKGTHDLLFKRLVLVLYGLYLLISPGIRICYPELPERGRASEGAGLGRRTGAGWWAPSAAEMCRVWLPHASHQPHGSIAAPQKMGLSKQ